jgi:hypothetical protein
LVARVFGTSRLPIAAVRRSTVNVGDHPPTSANMAAFRLGQPRAARGALFATATASCQRAAHKHQRSPGCKPGKPTSGTGVDKSLPRDFENARNSAVITAQTVWLGDRKPYRLVDPDVGVSVSHRRRAIITALHQSSNNMLRGLHRGCGPALPAAPLLIGIDVMMMTGAAAQGTPQARQACAPDAMRLCSDFLSDVSHTTRCKLAKRAYWSQCRAAMGDRASRRAYRHYRYGTHGRCR